MEPTRPTKTAIFIPKRDASSISSTREKKNAGVELDADDVLDSTLWAGETSPASSVRLVPKRPHPRASGFDVEGLQRPITGNEAYVDFFGYTIDSPDANEKRELYDTWCVNHGWEQGDGSSVTQFWDWYYDQVRLSTEFKTTYGFKNWNNLFKGNGTHNTTAPRWRHDGRVTYDANYYSELTRTTDYGDLFAHMPASSQKVAAKSYFVDNASPLGAVAPLDDTTTAWLRYYGAGWRFTYTNYANPTTVTSNDYANSQWNKDANVYDRDYEMFDSYIQVGAMPADAVPANEAGDYENNFRACDAKYISLSAGLIDAVTWDPATWDNATWHKDAMTGNGLDAAKVKGNAIKTIRITTCPSTRK